MWIGVLNGLGIVLFRMRGIEMCYDGEVDKHELLFVVSIESLYMFFNALDAIWMDGFARWMVKRADECYN